MSVEPSRGRPRAGRSPYVRYGKAPFAYSDLYRRWRTAILAGDDAEARRLGRMHDARHFPRDLAAS